MRRGYFYTLTTLFFTGLLLVLFNTSMTQDPIDAEQSASQAHAMDDFLQDLEQDLDRAAFIAGFRALIALEQELAQSGSYLADVESSFTQAFLNGTVDGDPKEVLENSTFKQYLQRVSSQAQQRGFKPAIDVLDVELSHNAPWELSITYDLRIRLNNTHDTMRWDYNKSLSTTMPIFDLRDPLYGVGTNNKVPTTITRHPGYDSFIDDNDTSVLQEFLENTYYTTSEDAPSFLQRFEGNLTPNEHGIQSLVSLERLDAQDVALDTSASLADHEYFQGITAAVCEVQNMPEYFKLTTQAAERYNIQEELEYSLCP